MRIYKDTYLHVCVLMSLRICEFAYLSASNFMSQRI